MPAAITSQNRYTDQVFDRLQLDNTRTNTSEFFDCAFRECTFVESVFHQCRFINCAFQGCDLSLVQVPESSFTGVIFEDSKCIGINWALANWPVTTLGVPLRFNKCNLSLSTFIGLSLPGIQIADCLAVDVDFREADLSRSDFNETDLTNSLFSQTNLSGADLSLARNYIIDPTENILIGARFSLPEAMSLLYSMNIDLLDGET